MTSTVRETPSPLLVGAAVVALQGAGLVVLGVLELAHLTSGRVTLGLTTTVFFWVLGVGLLNCAWGLSRVRSWARGPVVAGELIGALTAYSFWGGGTTAYAVGLAVTCVLALLGVLHPASTRALAAAPD